MDAMLCFGKEILNHILVVITKCNPTTLATAKTTIEQECHVLELPFVYFTTQTDGWVVPPLENREQIDRLLKAAQRVEPIKVSEILSFVQRVEVKAKEIAEKEPKKAKIQNEVE